MNRVDALERCRQRRTHAVLKMQLEHTATPQQQRRSSSATTAASSAGGSANRSLPVGLPRERTQPAERQAEPNTPSRALAHPLTLALPEGCAAYGFGADQLRDAFFPCVHGQYHSRALSTSSLISCVGRRMH